MLTVDEILKTINKELASIDESRKVILDMTKEFYELTPEDKDWIEVKTGAEILQITPNTVYCMINDGKIECKEIRSKKFVRKSELLKLNDHKAGKYVSAN